MQVQNNFLCTILLFLLDISQLDEVVESLYILCIFALRLVGAAIEEQLFIHAAGLADELGIAQDFLFPFVEPGFELDINCLICGGEGCPSCKHSGWLELCPCGMIHPNVLREGGIDPDEYTGFAFGLGLTRLAMMKYGIKDIRDLNSGALVNLEQFTDDE